MKYFKKIIVTIISLFGFTNIVLAANANVTSASQVVVGNKVTVTVNLSSTIAMGSLQMSLNYDKNYLDLVSSNAENGTSMLYYTHDIKGFKSKSYSFTFKTKKTGTTKVSVSGATAWALDSEEPLKVNMGSKNIRIITQAELEASYSKDNYLKSLSVEGFDLNPKFDKDTSEYSLVVPEDTKEINIKGSVNDSNSTVTGTGTKEVSAGNNTFEINVKAQNGSYRTYTINVSVKDSNPINVSVDNNEYTVVKIKEYLPNINNYQESTIKIDEFDIPSYYSEITKFNLVGLKNTNGDVSLFIYDNGVYKKYEEIEANNIVLYPKSIDKEISNYKKTELEINDIKVSGYKSSEKSNYAIIYAINVSDGKEGFYKYDLKNNVFIEFDTEMNDLLTDYINKTNLYSYIIIGFSIILFVMLLLLFKKRKPKKIKENKKEKKNKEKHKEKVKPEEKEDNKIVEISHDLEKKEDEEDEAIFIKKKNAK